MDKLYEVGEKVHYRIYDDKGEEKWYAGVIHGVRTYENKGIVKALSYLVDTGRNTRVDEYPFDHRDREINKRINKLRKPGEDIDKVLNKVLKDTDLPAPKLDIERVRQPEQLEVAPDNLRPAEKK